MHFTSAIDRLSSGTFSFHQCVCFSAYILNSSAPAVGFTPSSIPYFLALKSNFRGRVQIHFAVEPSCCRACFNIFIEEIVLERLRAASASSCT